jgi:hypothetical protein
LGNTNKCINRLSGAVLDNTLSFNLFPSVNAGDFTINIDGLNEKLVEVIDVMGRIVYSQKTSNEKIELSLKLNSALYYAKIVSGDKGG